MQSIVGQRRPKSRTAELRRLGGISLNWLAQIACDVRSEPAVKSINAPGRALTAKVIISPLCDMIHMGRGRRRQRRWICRVTARNLPPGANTRQISFIRFINGYTTSFELPKQIYLGICPKKSMAVTLENQLSAKGIFSNIKLAFITIPRCASCVCALSRM